MEDISSPIGERDVPASISPQVGDLQQASHLGNSVATGMVWLLAQTIGTRACAFFAQLVLARILLPKDFAALALSGTVTIFIAVLADFGITDVLLQRLKKLAVWSATAFWTSLAFGILSMLIVLGLAPVAALIYHAPVLAPMLAIIAISLPMNALATVPTVTLRAKMNFRFLAVYGSVEFIIIQAMIITIAAAGGGPFSFVVPLPIMGFLKAVIFWLYTRPKLHSFSFRQCKIMLGRGIAVFGSGLITVAVGQGDYFVLGLLAPKILVGAYYFAFRLAIQPVQMLAGSLSNVLFPTLTKLQTDQAKQRKAVLAASQMLAFSVMPYCFLQSALARPLLELAFGSKWQLSVPLMQILSVGLAFDCVSWIAASLQSARGHFKRALFYSSVLAVIFFAFIIVGTLKASALGTACAVCSFYVITQPVFVYTVFKSIGITFRQVVQIYFKPVLFSAMAMGSADELANLAGDSNTLKLIILVLAGLLLYAVLVRIFAADVYAETIVRFRSAIIRKHS